MIVSQEEEPLFDAHRHQADTDSPELPEEPQTHPSSFPRSVAFIIGNEFCERYETSLLMIADCSRFSFYGMKAILPLYLTGSLGFSENRSTTIIHTFNFSAYFFTLFGSCVHEERRCRHYASSW